MDKRTEDEMKDMTRKLAREAGNDELEPAGGRDFPSAVGPGGVPLGQQGSGQSDDISGQAPAAGARQHANPAFRRDGEVDADAVGDGTKSSSD